MNARKLFTIVLTAGLVLALSGGELALATSAATFDGPITVTADSSLTAGEYVGYADGLTGEQYVQVGSNRDPLSIAQGSTLALGTTDVYTLTVAREIHSGNMAVNQGNVHITGGGSVANLTVSGGSLTVVNPSPYADTSKNLTIDTGGSLTLGQTKFQADNNTAFQVNGAITDSSVQEIIFDGGTVTATGDGDMSDVHFSLVEGTSTTLDLTGYAIASFGDPLPLTYHPGNDSAFLTIEGSFAGEAEFKTSWLWDLTGEWDALVDEDVLSYIVWNPRDSDDWEWDGGKLVGSVTMEFTPMPEPATMLLLGFGALGMLLEKRRRSSFDATPFGLRPQDRRQDK